MPGGFGLWLLRAKSDRHSDWIAELRAILEFLGTNPPDEPSEPIGPLPRGHMETRLTDDGLILTPEGSPSRDVSVVIQKYFPHRVWTDAARVSYHEAHWSNTAERNTLAQAGGRCGVPIGTLPDGTRIVSEQSVGLYQINVCSHGHDRDYWRDADNNVSFAAALYAVNGWRDWVYTANKLGLL